MVPTGLTTRRNGCQSERKTAPSIGNTKILIYSSDALFKLYITLPPHQSHAQNGGSNSTPLVTNSNETGLFNNANVT